MPVEIRDGAALPELMLAFDVAVAGRPGPVFSDDMDD